MDQFGGGANTFRVEVAGYGQFPRVTVRIERTFWMAPAQVRRPVAYDETRKVQNVGKVLQADRLELVSFKQG